MCELSFINTGDADINRSVAYAFAFVNGIKNKDGSGFWSGSLWKTELQGTSITNLMPILNKKILDNAPVIIHTRLATTGVGGVREISEYNSHPFEGKYFVLAHNGSLEPKVLLTHDEKKALGSIIDSEYFLIKLEETKEDDFVKRLQKTMENFIGKFAFLIYSKRSKSYYAVRGSSATLHYIPIFSSVKEDGSSEQIGYAINTDKDDLVRSLVLAKNIANVYGKDFDFDSKEILEMPKETIFKLERDKAVKVGELKENFRVAATAQTSFANRGSSHVQSGGTNGFGSSPQSKLKEPGEAFLDLVDDWELSLLDVDRIVYAIFGSYLIELTASQINKLDIVAKEFRKRISPKQINKWKEMLKLHDSETYYQLGIKFPFCFEEVNVLSATLAVMKKEAAK